MSQADAAARMNVSTRTVTSAAKILEQGSPELIEAVKADTVPVKTAAVISALHQTKQAEIVSEGPEAVADAAKAIREEKSPAPAKQRLSMDRADILARTWNQSTKIQRMRFLEKVEPSVSQHLAMLGGGE